MNFKFRGNKYNYNPATREIHLEKGKELDKEVFRYILNLTTSVLSKGFSLSMRDGEFQRYISILAAEDKEKLFHKISNHYLYALDYLDEPELSRDGYFKIMNKVKRCERFLYYIIQS